MRKPPKHQSLYFTIPTIAAHYLLQQPGTIDEEAKAPLLGALREAWCHRLGSWAWPEFPQPIQLECAEV